jgi:hypothetical protein
MKTKPITSVTYILIGNMLAIYSSIGEGWSAKLTAFFGLILFFIGLFQLKEFLDEKGASGVGKLIWAAILGIIANIFSLIPIVGGIPAGILNLIAFILQVVGLVNLKHSEKLGKTGASGVNLLLAAITLMIFASIFKIVPFVGTTIKSIIAFIAFIIIPFGWVKIQEAITVNGLSISSTVSAAGSSQTNEKEVEEPDGFDLGEWFRKNILLISGIFGLVVVLGGAYYIFLKPNPKKDAIKAANIFCKCNEKNNEQIISLYNSFIRDLKMNKYESRQIARTRLQAIRDSSELINANCIVEVQSSYQNLRSKYLNNLKLLSDFDMTFSENRKVNCAASNENDLNTAFSNVENQISQLKDNEALLEANFLDINKFFIAFKQAIESKDMLKISSFVNFPFKEQGSDMSKETFIKNFKIADRIIDMIKNSVAPRQYDPTHFSIEGTGMGFSKHGDGYWKWDDINYGE